MLKELKDKWVTALRSGMYKQGHLRLRPSENTYCCLGVLADCLSPSGWSKEQSNYYFHGLGGEFSPAELEAIGLPSHIQSDLISLNDRWEKRTGIPTEPKSFSFIADWIEKNL